MKNKNLFILIFFLFLSACTDSKQIFFDFNNVKQKIVINSVNNIDSVPKIFISHVNSLNEDTMDFSSIKNAKINLYADNLFLGKIDNFKISDTNFNYGYFFNKNIYIPQNIDSIKIRVNANDYTEVEGADKIPDKIVIDSLHFLKKIDTILYVDYANGGFDTTLCTKANVFLSLSDPNPNEKNYFAVKVYYKKLNGHYENVYFKSNNNQLFDTYLFDEGFIFSDKIFINGKISLDFEVNTDIPMENRNPIYLEIKSISKSYFDYLTSYKKSKAAEQDIFSEYINVTSNVKNGYGIFTFYRSKRFIIKK
jgi:hypothetical protein